MGEDCMLEIGSPNVVLDSMRDLNGSSNLDCMLKRTDFSWVVDIERGLIRAFDSWDSLEVDIPP